MNEERIQYYIIQYQGASGNWYDGHRFDTEQEAFKRSKDPMSLVFMDAPHRIVKRIITESVLLTLDPVPFP